MHGNAVTSTQKLGHQRIDSRRLERAGRVRGQGYRTFFLCLQTRQFLERLGFFDE